MTLGSSIGGWEMMGWVVWPCLKTQPLNPIVINKESALKIIFFIVIILVMIIFSF